MDRDTNHLDEIEDLRYEIMPKGRGSSYDALFKVIIIGDSGKLTIFGLASSKVLESLA